MAVRAFLAVAMSGFEWTVLIIFAPAAYWALKSLDHLNDTLYEIKELLIVSRPHQETAEEVQAESALSASPLRRDVPEA